MLNVLELIYIFINFYIFGDSAVRFSVFENIILYGDEKGCLVVWNFGKGSTNKYFPDGSHQQITCVVCSLHYQNLVAVGYKSGAVSIVDFQNRGMVIYCMFNVHLVTVSTKWWLLSLM